MDTLLASSHFRWRATDWVAAAVAGLAAGALLMVLDLFWSAFLHPHGPWRISHMIAPIFIGVDSLKLTGYGFSMGVVAVSLAVHYAAGILFGLVSGAVLAQFRLDESATLAVLAGGIMGCALYLFNFDLLTGVLPWLVELRGGDTLAAHIVFGCVAALLYWRLKRTTTGS